MKPGNSHGPTDQGVDDLIAQDPNAIWYNPDPDASKPWARTLQPEWVSGRRRSRTVSERMRRQSRRLDQCQSRIGAITVMSPAELGSLSNCDITVRKSRLFHRPAGIGHGDNQVVVGTARQGPRTNSTRPATTVENSARFSRLSFWFGRNSKVSLNITIVGTADRQLEELLRAPTTRIKTMPVAELLALAQPSASQPDVVILDLRESNALPPTLATLKRQHPTTGVIIVAARMDPALMLEAMRAGVTEWVADPVTRGRAERGRRARQLSEPVERRRARSSRSSAPKAASARRRWRSTSRRRWRRRVDDERTLLIDFHLSYGDAAVFLGAEPRFSVVDAMENTHRLDEAFFESLVVQSKIDGVAPAGLGRTRRRRGRHAAHRARCFSSPRRTIATRSSTCRGRKPPCSIRSRAWRAS